MAQTTSPNIIVIVFDAWSQHHVSLYGKYPRQSTPNLEKFVEQATIYHNHYSPGTYTVPGTSSLLTGMHPWSHRAFQLGAGLAPQHAAHPVFSALSSTHSTLAYTQNRFADQILFQAQDHLTGNPIPNWAEGRLLPNLGGEADQGRSVFSMDAKSNSSFGPLTNYVMSITRDRQRLTYYCYPKDDDQQYEFYDLDADPLEMKDLFSSPPTLAHEMKDELLQKIEEFNRPYRRGGE